MERILSMEKHQERQKSFIVKVMEAAPEGVKRFAIGVGAGLMLFGGTFTNHSVAFATLEGSREITSASWISWITVSGTGCNGTCTAVSGRYRGRRVITESGNTLRQTIDVEANALAPMSTSPFNAQGRAGATHRANGIASTHWDSSWRLHNSLSTSTRTITSQTIVPAEARVQVRPVLR